MKLLRRIASVVWGPVMLGGLLLGGSSAFHHAAGQANEPVGLNLLSDTINFSGLFTLGHGTFAISSTSCHLTDGGVTVANPVTIPCHLAAGGHIANPETMTATGTVTITGQDGTITFQQAASGGCSTGTGYEIDPADHSGPIAIRTEGTSIAGSATWPNSFPVSGQIKVYEAGGTGTIGEGCLPG